MIFGNKSIPDWSVHSQTHITTSVRPGFSESNDVDEITVDDGEMNADVEDSEFAQQLTRMLLTFFLESIVCVWEKWELYVF